MTPRNQHQTELLEIYRLALLDNPQAIAPPDLDGDLAEFARKLVASQRQPHLEPTAKSRIWQNVLNESNAMSPTLSEEKHTMLNTAVQPRSILLKSRLSLPLVAMLALILIGGFLFWGLSGQTPPPATTNPGVYVQSTATATPLMIVTVGAPDLPPLAGTPDNRLIHPFLVYPTLNPNLDSGIILEDRESISFILTPSPTHNPEQVDDDIPSTASLDTARIPMVYQTWNNGGPASVEMALNYIGVDPAYGQELIRANVAPHPEDKFAQPNELVSFVQQLDANEYDAVYRIGGDMDVLKRLIANDIPVIIVTGYEPDDTLGWFAQYILIVGYDDEAGEFYVYDPYLGNGDGSGRAIAYETFDDDWRQMNRAFIAVYEGKFKNDAVYRNEMNQILGDYGTRANNIPDQEQAAIEKAREEAETINDIWAWLNLGEALANTENFEEAGTAFDQISGGLALHRILWYRQSILETYYQLQRYDELETLLDYAGFPAPEQEFIWYYRGRIKMSQGVDHYADAREDFIHALAISPNYLPAQKALTTVDDYLNRISYDTVVIGESFELWGCYSTLDYGSLPQELPIDENNISRIIQGYDTGSHVGIDIEVSRLTEIHSSGAGTVVFSGWTDGYENSVVIAHLNSDEVYFTLYTHVDGFSVFCGQRVEEYDIIASTGDNDSRRTHPFHFEVRDAEFKPIDPAGLFEEFAEE